MCLHSMFASEGCISGRTAGGVRYIEDRSSTLYLRLALASVEGCGEALKRQNLESLVKLKDRSKGEFVRQVVEPARTHRLLSRPFRYFNRSRKMRSTSYGCSGPASHSASFVIFA